MGCSRTSCVQDSLNKFRFFGHVAPLKLMVGRPCRCAAPAAVLWRHVHITVHTRCLCVIIGKEGR